MRFNQIIKQVSSSESLKSGRETIRYWSIGSYSWSDFAKCISVSSSDIERQIIAEFAMDYHHCSSYQHSFILRRLQFSASNIVYSGELEFRVLEFTLSCLHKTINAYNSLLNCRIVNKEKADICTKALLLDNLFRDFIFLTWSSRNKLKLSFAWRKATYECILF